MPARPPSRSSIWILSGTGLVITISAGPLTAGSGIEVLATRPSTDPQALGRCEKPRELMKCILQLSNLCRAIRQVTAKAGS